MTTNLHMPETWHPGRTLTNEQLAETANVLLAQVDRADLHITYAGNGWFHRILRHSGMTSPYKERRREVERSVRGLHERIAREAAERPEKEAAARRDRAMHEMLIEAVRQYLINTASDKAEFAEYRAAAKRYLSLAEGEPCTLANG